MQQGWIKLHRKIQEHWIYQEKRKFSQYEAWLDMLMMASYKDTKFILGKEVVEVARGGFVTSELKLMERWGWGKEKVRSFLKLLENDSMIIKTTDRKKTTINICNYSVYHDSESDVRPMSDRKSDHSLSENQTTNRPQQTVGVTGIEKFDQPQTDRQQTANQTTDRTQSRSKEIKNIVEDKTELENRFINLRGRGLVLSALDYQAIDQVIEFGVPLETSLKLMDECFDQYKPRFPMDTISSFKYVAKYIMNNFHRLQAENKPKPPSRHDMLSALNEWISNGGDPSDFPGIEQFRG